MTGRRSGNWFKGDPLAQGRESADVVQSCAWTAHPGVVDIGTEINEAGFEVVEQAPDDDQNGPVNRDDGLLLAASAGDASVASAQQGVGHAGTDSGSAQVPGQVAVAVIGGPLPLARSADSLTPGVNVAQESGNGSGPGRLRR